MLTYHHKFDIEKLADEQENILKRIVEQSQTGFMNTLQLNWFVESNGWVIDKYVSFLIDGPEIIADPAKGLRREFNLYDPDSFQKILEFIEVELNS